jgi:hypothetical protein
MPQSLGLIKPEDDLHIVKYSLTAEGVTFPEDVPVTLGIEWPASFDTPRKTSDGSYHLPDVEKGERLGPIRGGHCVTLEPMGAVRHNKEATRRFYNQGVEGACVGFGCSRNRTIQEQGVTFDALWLYDQARILEGRPTEEGSTVRAGFAVLRQKGHRQQSGAVCTRGAADGPVEGRYGVAAYRWASTAEEVCRALARPKAHAVPLVNSWGDDYPAVVWLPVATLQHLLDREGEAGVATDR